MGADHAQLKQLETRRGEALRRMSALQAEEAAIHRKIQAERADLASIDHEIQKLKAKQRDLVISEHAILRYLERVWGMDIEAIKQEMVPPTAREAIRALGNGLFPAGKHKIRVRDGVVVTVTSKEGERD